MVLELGSVSMGQGQVELVLDQEALDQVGLVLARPLVVIMDQVVLDQEDLDQVGVVLAPPLVVIMDQVALDQEDLDQVELVLARL